ncbi:MAG TPA: hypothetical protein VJS44_10370 [Pyrinomonadaceae bacterium]|nr:hypothetical protein [Pyrinomonadaceae bacterium]
MVDQIVQAVSLLGHVIEDQSFDSLSQSNFIAEIFGPKTRLAQHRQGGFFVFTDLLAGDYTVRISGEQFRTEEFAVTLPFSPLFLDAPGDDELAVVIKSLDNAATKITFDAVVLPKPFKAGSQVVSSGFTGTLAAPLDAGKVTAAKLNSLTGLSVGDIVRIIRDKSIRLRYGPYGELPPDFTRVIGKTVFKGPPDRALEGVLVRLTEVNGAAVTVTNVAGAQIVTAQISGKTVVMGSLRDTETLSNHNGDYNLYFNQPDITGVTLEASRAGLQTAAKTIAITPKARHRADFEMLKV